MCIWCDAYTELMCRCAGEWRQSATPLWWIPIAASLVSWKQPCLPGSSAHQLPGFSTDFIESSMRLVAQGVGLSRPTPHAQLSSILVLSSTTPSTHQGVLAAPA